MKKFVLALLWLLGGLTPALAVSEGAIPHEPIPAPYWQSDPVAPSGYANALALDAADRPHLVYHDTATGMLRYAVRPAEAWAFGDIAYTPYTPGDLSFDLALTPDGVPCVAYASAGSDPLLFFGCLEKDTWQMEMIAEGGRSVSLRVDRGGRPHIALIQQSNNVVYMTRDDEGVWQTEIVEQPGRYAARLWLVIDSQRRPHVIYHGPLPPMRTTGSTHNDPNSPSVLTDDQPHMIHAVRQSANVWEKQPLPFSQVEAAALGPADELWLLVSEWQVQWGHPPFSSAKLMLAQPAGDDWTTEFLREDYDWQIEADLAVDLSGRAHVVYRDITGLVHYGRRALDGTWERHSPGLAEQIEISMKLGGDGQPRLTLQREGQMVLMTRVHILDKMVYVPGIWR